MRSAEISFRGGDDSPKFHDVLSDLKRRGCNILVTGRVSETTTNRTTMQLLGASTEERKRILVLTDTVARYANSKLPGGTNADDPDVWVIDWGDDERAASRSMAAPSQPGVTVSSEESLRELRGDIVTAVSFFDEWADGLSTSELRLSFDSLIKPLEQCEQETVEQFLRTVTALVRGVSGMAHYHLPVPDSNSVVQELTPLFDARVELRQTNGLVPEQRWHIPEYGQTTNWVRL
ncbi:hypothetical protein ZOD2009_07434 [Haladaptatus paucihalophilus DX253]|uniref:Uncharacterized protein n=1 Tax=Haladaptatus paucihalophilus DX253 TaxID=797209 RepID=E7QRR4_HALPU|nr:hypothetical protein [Haladaptatus paucihalophilus]EFW92683.1 hypothetical protein ZOD2009_07434 [Haladaptatus paucihalophilus DX253]SHK15848.1 hypothetical protein SAMN05444342_0774 [Haladaptatus paucihalophilus DX253]